LSAIQPPSEFAADMVTVEPGPVELGLDRVGQAATVGVRL
jgi:hypothetical protein